MRPDSFAAARYSSERGALQPPAPMHSTEEFFNFFWPSGPTSGMIRWRL